MTTKCNCNSKKGFACSKCSKIKMSIMLLPDNQNLKLKLPNGDRVNPCWYSPIKQNNQENEKIIEGMIKRFSKTKLANFTRCLLFFDTTTDTLIFESHR